MRRVVRGYWTLLIYLCAITVILYYQYVNIYTIIHPESQLYREDVYGSYNSWYDRIVIYEDKIDTADNPYITYESVLMHEKGHQKLRLLHLLYFFIPPLGLYYLFTRRPVAAISPIMLITGLLLLEEGILEIIYTHRVYPYILQPLGFFWSATIILFAGWFLYDRGKEVELYLR